MRANPIGHAYRHGDDSPGDYEIVGVVEDTTYTRVRWTGSRDVLLPLLQRPASDKGPIEKDLALYAGAIVLRPRGR